MNNPFQEFWQEYPRKVGKGAARRAFEQALCIESAGNLIRAVREHAAFWQDAQTAIEFIPHPATWLNQERWEDELQRSETRQEMLKRVLRETIEARTPKASPFC